MTDPVPTPTDTVLTGAQKAVAAAVIGSLATVLWFCADLLPDPWRTVAMTVAALLGVLGAPFGVYVTVNRPTRV